MNPVLAIVGPTAIGKTALALRLAEAIGGEVINADSRQVYRSMDIGTAKPAPAERARVPHHLLDLVDPDQDFSLALYQDLAYRAIDDVRERGKRPLLVGGSGQYVWAVLEGSRIPPAPPQPDLRRKMEARAHADGGADLFAELQAVDPEAATRIDPRNLRRVIRALEVYHVTGRPFSAWQRRVPPDFPFTIIGLTADRARLDARINARVDDMIAQGFVEEVRRLLDCGYGLDLPSMSSHGYREIGRYLLGEWELAAAIEQTKARTRRFARRQYAWFRLSDPRIRWFDVDVGIEAVAESVAMDLATSPQQG